MAGSSDQQIVFSNWINATLADRDVKPVKSVLTELRSGYILFLLVETVSGEPLTRYGRCSSKSLNRDQFIDNNKVLFRYLKAYGIRPVSVTPDDIADGSGYHVLSLVWSIMCWSFAGRLGGLATGESPGGASGVRRALLRWLSRHCRSQHDLLPLMDLSCSLADGRVLLCVLGELAGRTYVASGDPETDLAAAMSTARRLYGVSALAGVRGSVWTDDERVTIPFLMDLRSKAPEGAAHDSPGSVGGASSGGPVSFGLSPPGSAGAPLSGGASSRFAAAGAEELSRAQRWVQEELWAEELRARQGGRASSSDDDDHAAAHDDEGGSGGDGDRGSPLSFLQRRVFQVEEARGEAVGALVQSEREAGARRLPVGDLMEAQAHEVAGLRLRAEAAEQALRAEAARAAAAAESRHREALERLEAAHAERLGEALAHKDEERRAAFEEGGGVATERLRAAEGEAAALRAQLDAARAAATDARWAAEVGQQHARPPPPYHFVRWIFVRWIFSERI